MTWIIICNPKFYDAERAFDTCEWVDWRQNRNIKPGDTVYVYCGAPIKEMRYKCSVLESDMETSSFNDADWLPSLFDRFSSILTPKSHKNHVFDAISCQSVIEI